MKNKYHIFTKLRLGLDSSVWLTMLIVLIISVFILSFKLITRVDCSLDEISVTGIKQQTNNVFYIGETVTFSLPNQSGDKFQWNFNDGTAIQNGGKIIQHNFLKQGAFNIVCLTLNGKCEQLVQVNIIPVPPKSDDALIYIGPSIIGMDTVNTGVIAHYSTSLKATYAYQWSASGLPGIQSTQDANFTFYKDGPQILTLKIDGKTYIKTIVVLLKKAFYNNSVPVPTSFKIPPSVKSISPASGGPNTVVTIMGDFFNNVTSVSFGGIEAKAFTVISSMQIMATVNEGSQTGAVMVTTAIGPSPSPTPQFNYISPPKPAPVQVPTLSGPDKLPPHVSISDGNLKTLLSKFITGEADASKVASYFCSGDATLVKVNKEKKLIPLSELCQRLQKSKKIIIDSAHIVPDLNNPSCETSLTVQYKDPKKYILF